MNRKNLTWLILVVIVLFLPLSVFAQGELVILHTNDLHGQSLARLATIVEEQRALHPHALLVDAGDLFSGTAVSSIFQGQAEQEAVLAMGYDALAIGNHDFDFGKAVVQKSLDRGLPWLSANIWQGDLCPTFRHHESQRGPGFVGWSHLRCYPENGLR